MSEEIYGMVQILELYGKGMGALGKAIRFSAQGAQKGVDYVKLKDMQIRMKLHYASTGTHDTMRLSDLEKLTGGQFDVLSIPFEEKDLLLDFYDQLKKVKIPFAELPDLDLGDGFTQIAFNPQDASLLKTVTNRYKERLDMTCISLEEYAQTGGEKGEKLLTELAQKGYEDERSLFHVENILEKNKSTEYIPIGLNIEKMLLVEEKDRYLCRIPGSIEKDRYGDVTAMGMYIKKEDVLILDEGKTLFTHLKVGEENTVLSLDSSYRPTGSTTTYQTSDLAKYFDLKSGKKEKEQANKVRWNKAECLPNFKKGNESMRDDFPQSKPEKTIETVMKKENMKEKAAKGEHIPIAVDVKESLLSESSFLYVIKVPQSADLENETLSVVVVNKNDAMLSKDGKTLHTFLKTDGTTKVHERNVSTGKTVAIREVKNSDLAKLYEVAKKEVGERIYTKTISDHDLLKKGIEVKLPEKISGRER